MVCPISLAPAFRLRQRRSIQNTMRTHFSTTSGRRAHPRHPARGHLEDLRIVGITTSASPHCSLCRTPSISPALPLANRAPNHARSRTGRAQFLRREPTSRVTRSKFRTARKAPRSPPSPPVLRGGSTTEDNSPFQPETQIPESSRLSSPNSGTHEHFRAARSTLHPSAADATLSHRTPQTPRRRP